MPILSRFRCCSDTIHRGLELYIVLPRVGFLFGSDTIHRGLERLTFLPRTSSYFSSDTIHRGLEL